MKKWIAMLLAMLMSLSLCACGSTAPTADDAPEADAQEEAPEYPVYAITKYTNVLGTYELDDYELNDAGQITAYTKYETRNGERTGHSTNVTVTYDDAGNPVKMRYENYSGYEEVVREFDDQGLVTKESWSSDYSFNDGKVFAYTYIFDDEGRVSKETSTNENTGDSFERVYTYDENGYAVSYTETSYNPDGSVYSEWLLEMEYDDNGNIVKQIVTDTQDPDGGWDVEIVYDEIGTGTQEQPPCSGFHYIYPEWL